MSSDDAYSYTDCIFLTESIGVGYVFLHWNIVWFHSLCTQNEVASLLCAPCIMEHSHLHTYSHDAQRVGGGGSVEAQQLHMATWVPDSNPPMALINTLDLCGAWNRWRDDQLIFNNVIIMLFILRGKSIMKGICQIGTALTLKIKV